jgi:hypothetical protein
MVTYIPKQDTLTGADLSGTTGTANRTYTLNNTGSISAQFNIMVAGTSLQKDVQYTKSSSIITFLTPVWDDQSIVINYFILSTINTSTSTSFSSVLGLCDYLNITKSIPDATSTSQETVGTGDNSTTTFWLDNIGVIEDTYTLYHGTTALTETTHYTIDLETSKITLTSAGVTEVGLHIIYAEYKYNILNIPNDQLTKLLVYAEREIKRKTETTFADYTADNPQYNQILNETKEGRFDARWKTFDMFFNPIINLSTTVASDYTTGGTEITLTDATGFPDAATIYINGNKITYTAKSANNLTVPPTTPSITADSVVYGEVIEISKESEGTTPSYEVLERDIDYKIDFLQGRIELLGNAYFGEFQDSDRFYPANYIIRASYMNAWYEQGNVPEIPDDIETCTYMIATNRLMKSVVGKAHISGLNSFNPTLVAVDRTDIDQIIDYYKPLNIGTSPYNKSHIN